MFSSLDGMLVFRSLVLDFKERDALCLDLYFSTLIPAPALSIKPNMSSTLPFQNRLRLMGALCTFGSALRVSYASSAYTKGLEMTNKSVLP